MVNVLVPRVTPARVNGGGGGRSELVITWEVNIHVHTVHSIIFACVHLFCVSYVSIYVLYLNMKYCLEPLASVWSFISFNVKLKHIKKNSSNSV